MSKARDFSREEQDIIIHNYVDLRQGRAAAGREFNASDEQVLKILKQNGVHIRSVQESNVPKYKVNLDFFKTQSHDLGYVLGLIAADGCISTIDNQIYIELQRGDRELLEKVNKAIGNERPVKDYVSQRGYENSKLYFYSKDVKAILAEYHIVPNKTYSPLFLYPTNLDKEYQRDYIRGYFDGNGSVGLAHGGIYWKVCAPSEDVAKGISAYLTENGIDNQLYREPRVNIFNYIPRSYNQKNAHKIYHLIYDTTDNLYLERKHSHFIELLK